MTDNILDSDCQALVNPVNCVGVMGKGLAKQFKEKYPRYFSWYHLQCADGEVTPGKVSLYENPNGPDIISFPTKNDWKRPSHISWIKSGLWDLRRGLLTRPDITSIAIPPLGCGNGGLNWTDVEPLIRSALKDLEIRVDIYPPDGKKYQL